MNTAGEPVLVSDVPVVQNAVDSDQTGADAIADGAAVHVLMIEEGSGHIFHTWRETSGSWRPVTLVHDDVNAQWIRGNRLAIDGATVYGYVFDAGSDGGSGMNRYAEIPLGR